MLNCGWVGLDLTASGPQFHACTERKAIKFRSATRRLSYNVPTDNARPKAESLHCAVALVAYAWRKRGNNGELLSSVGGHFSASSGELLLPARFILIHFALSSRAVLSADVVSCTLTTAERQGFTLHVKTLSPTRTEDDKGADGWTIKPEISDTECISACGGVHRKRGQRGTANWAQA